MECLPQLFARRGVSWDMNKTGMPNTASMESVGTAAKPAGRTLLWLNLTLLIWFPLITILHAWVLTLLWAWFVVPQFGVAALPLPIAAGLDILFGFVVYRHSPQPPHASEDKDKQKTLSLSERLSRSYVENFGLALLRVGITLALGWIVHLFVRR